VIFPKKKGAGLISTVSLDLRLLVRKSKQLKCSNMESIRMPKTGGVIIFSLVTFKVGRDADGRSQRIVVVTCR
jgi:hypothetical protein